MVSLSSQNFADLPIIENINMHHVNVLVYMLPSVNNINKYGELIKLDFIDLNA